MSAYYNEFDPNAAAWLRELIKQGYIAPGDVDERSIEDVAPDDLKSYTQCHFFAGIGIWSYALRRAGWEDTRPVWTGSEPCQPFSAAGKGLGFTDERYLRPAWHHLIEHGKPAGVPVFGEQVASADGLAWLDVISSDMEGTGHTIWAVDLCSAGFGAPHIRQRLFWVAYTAGKRWRQGDADNPRCREGSYQEGLEQRTWGSRIPSRVADDQRKGLEGHGRYGDGREESRRLDSESSRSITEESATGRLAFSDGGNASAERKQRGWEQRQQPQDGGCGEQSGGTGPTNGFWRDADWLLCRDGWWRPVEPGTFPLAHGHPCRMGLLRGFGNAINAEVAIPFIEEAKQLISGVMCA